MVDGNGDGHLSKEEFLNSYQEAFGKEKRKKEIEKIFD
jgi:Ca2+-binding EF-hand superfamily protein